MANITTAVLPATQTSKRPKSGTTSPPNAEPPCGKPNLLIAESQPPRTRLIPVTDWSKHHDWPPVGGLRHLVFFEKTNGFANVVKRIGRRVLIDEAAFFTWVENQQAQLGNKP